MVTVYYPDGTVVVEHADGTRITMVKQQQEMANSSHQPSGSVRVASGQSKDSCSVAAETAAVVTDNDKETLISGGQKASELDTSGCEPEEPRSPVLTTDNDENPCADTAITGQFKYN